MNFTAAKRIVVLTGAGISRASGLRTYRGPEGIWNDPDTERFSTIDDFADAPDAYWKFWGNLRRVALQAEPNAAHRALAQWSKQLGEGRKLTIITQNVDELHQRAGSADVVELHGTAFRTRCSNDQCKLQPFHDTDAPNKTPLCSQCQSPLRPAIVMFGEMLPVDAEHSAKKALRDCDLFLAIGTSGTVSPASSFVSWAKYANARTVMINLEKMIPPNPAFDEELIGKAEEILPRLVG